jgi:hypothetical protein
MSEPTQEQLITEQLKSLPRPVQEAITSFDWAREVFDVGRKHALHVDEIGEIQTEVMLVVLGLISPKEFYDQMVSRIGIDEDQALEISSEVNDRVFVRIREFMKNYYAEEEKKGTVIAPSEKDILRGAGIKLGDEPEETEPAASEDHEDEEVFVPIAQPKPALPTGPSPAEEISEKLSQSKVFQNPPKNYFDPYREPLE